MSQERRPLVVNVVESDEMIDFDAWVRHLCRAALELEGYPVRSLDRSALDDGVDARKGHVLTVRNGPRGS